MSLSNFKNMLTLFFDIQDYVTAQSVPRARLSVTTIILKS